MRSALTWRFLSAALLTPAFAQADTLAHIRSQITAADGRWRIAINA